MVSLGYDSRFSPFSSWGYKAELSYNFKNSEIFGFKKTINHQLSIPIGINYLAGRGNNKLELGTVWRNGLDWYNININGSDYYSFEDGIVIIPNDSKKMNLSGTAAFQDVELNLGYRFQKSHGFNFRVGFITWLGSYYGKFYNGFEIALNPYVSFGYSF